MRTRWPCQSSEMGDRGQEMPQSGIVASCELFFEKLKI